MLPSVNNGCIRSIYVQRIDNLTVLVNEVHNENFGPLYMWAFFLLSKNEEWKSLDQDSTAWIDVFHL